MLNDTRSRNTSSFRHTVRSLLDFLLPLYSITSTPERSRYWRAMPIRRSAKLLVAVFFTLSGVAFFADLMNSGSYPLWGILLLGCVSGGLSVLMLLAHVRYPRFLLPTPALMVVGLILALIFLPKRPGIIQPEAAHQRIIFDAVGLFSAMLLGYRFFVGFAITEGLAHVQLQTELALAQAIQTTLVPPISYRTAVLEMYGRTIPSEAVGGDLVDVAASADGAVLAYLADVSGHGIPAGVLMGMVKTAVRQAMEFGQPLPLLLDGINRVLPAVKEPNMYATLAGLFFSSSSEVEYTVAGHLPLLHYRQLENDVIRRSMEQFPLGMFPATSYRSERVNCGPGDLFALVTDGLIETINETEEEFGLDRLEQLLQQNTTKPLEEIFEAILAAVVAHGYQQDDRTVLLVRVLR